MRTRRETSHCRRMRLKEAPRSSPWRGWWLYRVRASAALCTSHVTCTAREHMCNHWVRRRISLNRLEAAATETVASVDLLSWPSSCIMSTDGPSSVSDATLVRLTSGILDEDRVQADEAVSSSLPASQSDMLNRRASRCDRLRSDSGADSRGQYIIGPALGNALSRADDGKHIMAGRAGAPRLGRSVKERGYSSIGSVAEADAEAMCDKCAAQVISSAPGATHAPADGLGAVAGGARMRPTSGTSVGTSAAACSGMGECGGKSTGTRSRRERLRRERETSDPVSDSASSAAGCATSWCVAGGGILSRAGHEAAGTARPAQAARVAWQDRGGGGREVSAATGKRAGGLA